MTAIELQTPRDVLERRYRQIVEFCDARSVDFKCAVNVTDWDAKERAELLAYARSEYGLCA